MNNSHPISLMQDHSDFFLTLARAFLTPQTEEHYKAMVFYLADDLAELGQSLEFDIGAHLDALRIAMSKLVNHEALLLEYSRMFLQPPRAANLNVCLPLDGAIMGGTVSEIESFYRNFGVERGSHFKDLSDHVSVQLEFVSYLYGCAAEAMDSGKPDSEVEKAAGHFLHQFVRRWAPYFEAGIEKAGRKLELKANPYLPLAQIISIAAERCAKADQDWAKENKRTDAAIEKARQEYANRGITPEALADIERKLREKGLSTDHLHVALSSRNEALGLSAKSPPDPRRK